MTTTNISVTFRGNTEDLKDALATAIRYESKRRFSGRNHDTLTVMYICETDDYDEALRATMDSINIAKVEDLGCELVQIG